MANRTKDVRSFLERAGWSDAIRQPIQGDLSTRRYFRLVKDTQTCILMDANSSMSQFVRLTKWLQSINLAAPDILADSSEQGLLLLEDFGDTSLTLHLAKTPKSARDVYAQLVDLLLCIQNSDAPLDVDEPGAKELVEWTRLADEHYPGIDPNGLMGLREVLSEQLTTMLAQPLKLSLRDFHADNIMWRPKQDGLKKFGLLDYQDAFRTHSIYDVVSLLTDARTEISTPLKQHIVRDFSQKTGSELSEAEKQFAVFSAQRNLRILGIFYRAANSGKDHHLDKVPRVIGYLKDAVSHPVFDRVRADVFKAIPGLERDHDA